MPLSILFALMSAAVAAAGTDGVAAVAKKQTVIASSPWHVFPCPCDASGSTPCCNQRTLMVEVARLKDGQSRLAVLEPQGTTRTQLLELTRGDHFLGMMPTIVGGNLTTLWVGGSALKFIVLRYANGVVSVVLDVGTKSPPEVIMTSLENEPTIIVARWESLGGPAGGSPRPVRASIYCWKGDSYVRSRTVRWQDRFATAQEVCGSASKDGH